MKTQKSENINVNFRTQRTKLEELTKYARRDKRSVSALLTDALDVYLEKRSREYRKETNNE